jgi:hypothetical protein
MAIRPRMPGFAPLPPAPRAFRGNLVVDGAIFPVKRTKSATKRTSDRVAMRDTRGRALHSLLRDIADLRPSPRADGTYINTDNRISLAAGRTLSKTTLFWVLHFGGWFGFGTFVSAFRVAQWGALPALLDNEPWVALGFTFALALRSLFRRGRTAGWSYTSLGILALTSCLVVAVVWYVTALALERAILAGLVQLPGLGGTFGALATEVARQPWWLPFGHWMMYTFILLTWSS